ncbi:PAS domain S-box protein [Neptuniibacter sp.]|uniref:PAS domain S-box protein n=1 Tax=Neptuniibacter sp. TaxID=1962643 RepID=UPI00260C6736|nr:PAS domain S-box protein [Neptuniibacter sp.]MCP4596403.1 PAS domain S-box protein [Neptuniibacter sp.]
MKFRTKTIIGVALIEMVLLSILVIKVFALLSESNHSESERKIRLTETLLTASSQDAIIAYDLAALESLAENILDTGELSYIRFLDNNRQVLVEHWALENRTAIELFHADSSNIHKELPVTYSEQNFGFIQFGIDHSYMGQFFYNAIGEITTLAALEVLLVAAFSFLLGMYLTKQLKQLTQATSKLKQGKLGTTIPVTGSDELATTVAAFNSMSTHLEELEKANNKEKERLRELEQALNQSPVGIVIYSLDGKQLYANKHFARLTGFSIDRLIDHPRNYSNNFQPPEQFSAALAGLYSWDGNFRYERSDGSLFWARVSLSPIKNNHGNTIRMLEVVRDISQIRQAQEQLSRSEALFRANFSYAGLGIANINEQGMFVRVNERFCEILGYSEEELLSKTYLDITWLEDKNLGKEQIQQLNSGEIDHFVLDKRYRHKAGHPVHCRLTLTKTMTDDGLVNIACIEDRTQSRADELHIAESNQQMRSLLDNFPFMVWLKNNDGQFLAVNKPFSDACGAESPLALEGKTDFDIWPTDLANKYRHDDLKAIIHKEILNTEEMVETEGLRHWVETHKAPVELNGDVIGTVGYARDITERKEAQEKMLKAEVVFNSAKEGIILTDSNARVKMINPAFSTITGYYEKDIIGEKASILSSGKHDADFYNSLYEKLDVEGQWQGEIWNRKKNGELYVQWQTIVALKNDNGFVEEYLAIFSDITQRKEAEQEIEYRANYDQLTGLPNRSLLHELLKQVLVKNKREKKQCAVCFLDLDHFKRINDTLGHAIGDGLLKKVAIILKSSLRESDIVARLGGDEFIIVIPNLEDISFLNKLAEKLISAFNRPLQVDKHEIHTGISIGIAVAPFDGHDIDTLLSHADLAMYKAKESGRGQFHFYNQQMSQEIRSSRTIELELRKAIDEKKMDVAFQPIVALGSNTITGYEALARWKRTTGKETSPEVFIKHAEEFGLIEELFEVVFHKALVGFEQLIRDREQDNTYLSVNLSTYQIPKLLSIDWLLLSLEKHSLSPENIMLEITEGVLLSDSKETVDWLNEARQQGFRIAIDDFGTGYSSLSYLKQIPVDVLKIDRCFIQDINYDTSDMALVRAIIAMSNAFGVEVIAEGIETAEQQCLLSGLNCRLGQGYYLGKPFYIQEL